MYAVKIVFPAWHEESKNVAARVSRRAAEAITATRYNHEVSAQTAAREARRMLGHIAGITVTSGPVEAL